MNGGDIYTNPKRSREGFWTSFDTDPHLDNVKKTIQFRCTPCVRNLHRQLTGGKEPIELGSAYNCWKAVVVLADTEQCLRILESYRNKFLPGRQIMGRYGSAVSGGTQAIVANADTIEERDRLVAELTECVEESGLEAEILITRACVYLYGEIFGDWRKWEQSMTVRHPEKIPVVLKQLEKILAYA